MFISYLTVTSLPALGTYVHMYVRVYNARVTSRVFFRFYILIVSRCHSTTLALHFIYRVPLSKAMGAFLNAYERNILNAGQVALSVTRGNSAGCLSELVPLKVIVSFFFLYLYNFFKYIL